MRKPVDAKQLAVDILGRSTCCVKVGAAIEDHTGILAWGWNNVDKGYGICAERHAIQRANKKRLYGATIYVAGSRSRNGKPVPARPCAECRKAIDKWQLHVIWRDRDGMWQMEG